MRLTPIQMIPPVALAAGAQSSFRATARTRIDKVTFSNDTGGAVTVASYIVPSGSSNATAVNLITPDVSVGDGDVLIDGNVIGHVLNEGDQLVLASSVDGVVAMASGVMFE